MLVGHNLIYFAPENWDGLWRNRQQLMSIFARHNKVLFVEGRAHLRSTLADFRRGGIRVSDLRARVRQVSKNLFVFRFPVWAPISGRFPLKQITRTARQLSFQKVLRELQMSRPIVWLSRPSMMDVMDDLPSARLFIYHVVDEYAAYGTKTAESRYRIEKQEKEMLGQVDMVITVSKKLQETKRPFNPNTFLVPNGVNYQAYTAALADPCLPDDLRAIKPPRLGYSGLIGDKLDLDLLKELAQAHPEWSLVLLGEVKGSHKAATWRELRALPNVHHLGPVEIAQVPHYVKGFQVGLMPYAQTRHSEHISPLKLYDYLAAGLPVVSMDIPAAREFGEFIHLADTPQNFIEAVQAALVEVSVERCQARRNIASQHSWEARAEQLSALIQTQLVERV